jgi:hypothetical protein
LSLLVRTPNVAIIAMKFGSVGDSAICCGVGKRPFARAIGEERSAATQRHGAKGLMRKRSDTLETLPAPRTGGTHRAPIDDLALHEGQRSI